jgi:hypothetical protein
MSTSSTVGEEGSSRSTPTCSATYGAKMAAHGLRPQPMSISRPLAWLAAASASAFDVWL